MRAQILEAQLDNRGFVADLELICSTKLYSGLRTLYRYGIEPVCPTKVEKGCQNDREFVPNTKVYFIRVYTSVHANDATLLMTARGTAEEIKKIFKGNLQHSHFAFEQIKAEARKTGFATV